MNKTLTDREQNRLLKALKSRFEKYQSKFPHLEWNNLVDKLKKNPQKIWSLNQMEQQGGMPSLLSHDQSKDTFVFCDFSIESPSERRSLCYDKTGALSRKRSKPEKNAVDIAEEIGLDLMSKDQYKLLQEFNHFDTKTSSWLKTPEDIRGHGGAIFGDFRYGRVFIYHNAATSYFLSRGFRGVLEI